MRAVFALLSSLAVLWWFYDDHLAQMVGVAWLGHVPLVVWLPVWLSLEYAEYKDEIVAWRSRRARVTQHG